ncbi:MAG: sigma-70 family RNA polymerase sigma factor [Bacilli bacterium]
MIFTKKVDEEQFFLFLEQNRERFYRVAYSYTKNREDALDVLQESICKAIVGIHTLKHPNYMKTWFYRILINQSIDFIRKHKRVNVVEEEVLHFLQEPVSMNEDLRIDLESAFAVLDEKQKAVVILRFFEDMKIEDIATVLECNTNTVKTRLYNALKKLRIKMEGDM